MTTENAGADWWPDDEPADLAPCGADRCHPAERPAAVLARPCVVLAEDEPLTVAWHRIRQRNHWYGVVVDGDAHCVGLLGLREASGRWPTQPPLETEPTAGEVVRGVRVSRIGAGTTVRAAARTLLTARAEAAPVVGRDGRVIGLVTALDLLAGLVGPDQSVRLVGPTSGDSVGTGA